MNLFHWLEQFTSGLVIFRIEYKDSENIRWSVEVSTAENTTKQKKTHHTEMEDRKCRQHKNR